MELRTKSPLVYLLALAFALFVFIHGAVAQKIGLRAGFTLSNTYISSFDDLDRKMRPGFLVGPIAEFTLKNAISLETGALFISKGVRMEQRESFDGDRYEAKMDIGFNYLDIPITVKGTFGSDKARMFMSCGPYIGIGLSGTAVIKETIEVDSEVYTDDTHEDIKWGNSDGELRRFDYGICGGIGLEIKSFQLAATYGFGLANIAVSDAFSNVEIKQRVLGISLGYKFGAN